MATNYNPRIITDNLVFLVDAGNVKSYAGDVISETAGPAYGYYGGGQPSPTAVSTVDRIDYSSDTSTAAAKGPLSVARKYPGATGNSSYGYFGGGVPGPSSLVDRVDYSSDTPTATVKGSLSAARYGISATSSRANALPTSDRSNNQGIISYSDSSGEENDTTCQFDTDIDGKVKFSGALNDQLILSLTSALN